MMMIFTTWKDALEGRYNRWEIPLELNNAMEMKKLDKVARLFVMHSAWIWRKVLE